MTGLHGNKRTIWMAAIGLGLAAIDGRPLAYASRILRR